MQFVSLEFMIFMPVAALVYYVLPGKIKNIWLLMMSYIFYAYASVKFLPAIVLITVITYFGGISASVKGKEAGKKYVVISVILSLALLFVTKYTGFILSDVVGLPQDHKIITSIIAPIGISFYTLQAIGYVVDCYRGKVLPTRNIVNYALFVSFFPVVISGPIERADHMIPQFAKPASYDHENVRDGLMLMLWGFFLKMVLADRLAIVVNNVFTSPTEFAGTAVFITTIFYTFEIYTDFYGYSLIALGCAKVMGIQIMENFDAPYLSGSIQEFWRRWHISLSSWLRDYVYIPLGGNRKGIVRKYINVLLVFIVSGIWHGAGFTFMLWGLLHGVYQVIGQLMKPVRDAAVKMFRIDRESFSHRLVKIIVTFLLVNEAWILFGSDSIISAIHVMERSLLVTPATLFDGSLYGMGLSRPEFLLTILGLLLVVITDICKYRHIVIRTKIYKQEIWLRYAFYIVVVCFILVFGVWGGSYDATNFIYAQF